MSTIHAITAQGKTVKGAICREQLSIAHTKLAADSWACAGPNAVKELFEAAGPRLGIIGVAAKLPGFNFLFGTLYDAVSHNRCAVWLCHLALCQAWLTLLTLSLPSGLPSARAQPRCRRP